MLPRSGAAAVLSAAALLFSACGSVERPTPPPVDLVEVPLHAALSDEAVALTAELVRARPVVPPGGEARAVQIVAERLRAAGIPVDVRPFAGPDRTNLKAVLPGLRRDLPPVILLGHTDVVPADAAQWEDDAGPFDGVVKGAHLVGRGALDMLSMVALETLALVALKDAGLPLQRDVVLLLTGDEEVDGAGVQRAIVDWPEVARPGALALTEGSFYLESALAPGEDVAAVAVAEKGMFQFRISARGPSGHGSTPVDGAAPDRIVRATSRLLGRDAALRLTRPTRRMLASVGESRGGVQGAILGNPDLMVLLGRAQMEGSPTTRALFFDTCTLTMLQAGYKTNVVPGEASATFDCRLLPGTDPAAFRDEVLRVIDDPRVQLDVIEAARANGSPDDGLVVQVIRARMKRERPGVVVAPVLTKGATDARFLRARGVHAYGFVPIRASMAEVDAVHGARERVRVDELQKALPRLVDIVATLAVSTSPPP